MLTVGIVTRCQVYCSEILYTDYPIKIQHFHMLGTKSIYEKQGYMLKVYV